MRASTRQGITLILCLALLFVLGLPALASAQVVDEAPVELAPGERERLQAILDAPISPALSNRARIEVYRAKDLAAFRLGDNVARERVLREFAAIDEEGKWNLRLVLATTDKRDEAYRIGEELIILTRRTSIKSVRIRTNMAMDYLTDGLMSNAARLIAEAEAIVKSDFGQLRQQGDTEFWKLRAEIELHQAKGVLLRRQGRWAEGIEESRLSVERGMRLTRLMHLPISDADRTFAYAGLIRISGDLAKQHIGVGQYAEAEWILRDIYNKSREWGFDDKYLQTLYQRLGEYYAAIGRPEQGLPFLARAERISFESGLGRGTSRWHQLQLSQSVAFVTAGRWQDAVTRLESVETAMARPGGAPRQVRPQEVETRAYALLRLGRPDAAVGLLQSLVESRSRSLGPDHYFVALNRGLWAAALVATGQAAQARLEFARALRALTAPEALTGDFVEDALQKQMRRFILERYLDLLAEGAASNPADAQAVFEVADQLTASSVQQALAEAAVRSGVSTPGLAEIIRKEQDARNEHAALAAYVGAQTSEEARRQTPQIAEQMRNRMRELEGLRRGYKAQIQKEFPAYFQLVQPRSPSPQEIAAKLAPDELFLAVVPVGEAVFTWAIDAQGGLRFQRAALGEKQLAELVQRVRRTLDLGGFEGGKVPAFAFADAHQLYQSIFQPFDAQIAGKKHLVVATAGALAQIPFGLLPRRPHTGDLGSAPWLLKDVAVSHVPSANGWLALKRFGQATGPREPMMAWGDPVFDRKALGASAPAGAAAAAPSAARGGAESAALALEPDSFVVYSGLQPLPETREEVQALARIVQADLQQDLRLGDAATRQSVLDASKAGTLAKKRVVVFATHGLLAGDLPNLNQPALAMAANADASASPLLTLEDVLGLKLNADWVVLSACNTAGADGRAQEAMSGLARGFFYAGSRSLLVTHWSVESQSAMLLTTNTFEAYAKDPAITRAEALRQAMLKVMASKDYQHPAFWAPYAVVGDGGR